MKYPILGNVEKTESGKYYIKNPGTVGKIYTIICPQCKAALLARPESVSRFVKTCKECGTKIVYQGKKGLDEPAKESKEPVKEPNPPTRKYKVTAGHASDRQNRNIRGQERSGQGESLEAENNANKMGKPNAILTWGGLFNRKKYEFKRTGEHYIGRDDEEIRSDVSIHDEYVSRRSVLINVMPKDGKDCSYKMTVKNATNPVMINGRIMDIDESVYLNYGDTILVGNTTLTFKKDK